MFFQFSPVKAEKKPKFEPKENESEKVEILSLAPFTPTPKLFFEGVIVGETVTRKLLIKNQTNQDVTLFVSRGLPKELNVSYNWEQTTIERGSEAMFELTWCPIIEESTRHLITFEDLKKIQRAVPVAFKSISPKKIKPGNKHKLIQRTATRKQKTPPKKSPTKKYYTLKPSNISPRRYSPPKKKYSPSPKKRTPVKKSSVTFMKSSPSPKSRLENGLQNLEFSFTRNIVRGKENFPLTSLNASTDSNIFVSPRNASFHMDYLKPIERRETYVVDRNGKKLPTSTITKFNDSLDDISPTLSPVKEISYAEHSQHVYHQKLPLGIYNGNNVSPEISLTSFLEKNSMKPPETVISHDFEYKLRLGSFNFTPASTPVKYREKVTTPLSSRIEKVQRGCITDSARNLQLFSSQTHEFSTNNLNISSETYTKSNLSSETYVKENTSFETYVKDNLSGGTYTKDTSIGDVETLNVSPYLSNAQISPQNTTNLGELENYKNTFETSLWNGIDRQQLSCIEEESYLQSSMRESFTSSVQKSFAKRKSDVDFDFVPPKRPNISSGPKDWSKTGGAAFRVARKTSGLKLEKFVGKKKPGDNKEIQAELTKRDTNTIIIQNPFILAATNLVDPFMTPQLYVNEEWIDQQEKDFKKWLNALLTPPQELSSEDQVIDVAKVWQECKKQDVNIAPTKEIISNKYHTSKRLNNLRSAAQNLFRTSEISTVLAKVIAAVEAGKLSVRQDKDIHLNLSLKSEIMSLLLSYNPLWLRIGLETIYNEVLPLSSNSDIVGITTFIVNRLLKDPYLLKKHKSLHSPKYTADIKKFFLKKYLVLVYFLDQAKNKKLIPHDPCLFCKKGVVKESRELLLGLARETLSAVGDITKFLKFSGYIVTHVQTYIHEFDYAVKNLGVDLRDGVRLTKVMEIILMQENLTDNLRVPAISRLQKIHNMQIVFRSLEKAGYQILYDISPKDIVYGHKEKTLSFLWQIIYKFEAPLMVKSVTTIQTWFRSLPVVLKRKKLERIRMRKENAAKKIQSWYKRQKLSRKLLRFAVLLKRYSEILKLQRAAVKIQALYRMYRCRKVYKKQIKTITFVQSLSRGWLVRNVYRERIKSAVVIQSYIRMYFARKKYLKLKQAVTTTQRRYRANKLMKIEQTSYDKLKTTAIFIQNKFRAARLATREKRNYNMLKSAAVKVQRRFRANKIYTVVHERYTKLKSAALVIQTWYRSVKAMRICRERYLALKKSVRIVETRFMSTKLMKIERKNYQALKTAAITVQQRYRAQKAMSIARKEYVRTKKATIVLQQKYRAIKNMQYQKNYYKTLKSAAIYVQRKFRANKAMAFERSRYIKIKMAITTIQIWASATVKMKKCRNYYLSLKNAVIVIEGMYEAKKLMEKEKANYRRTKRAAVIIQRRYRALIVMRNQRKEYTDLKLATVFIQRMFRANKMAKTQRRQYIQLQQAAIILQNRFRAQRAMRKYRKDYIDLKMATLNIQRRFRANVLMKRQKMYYNKLLKYTLFVQRKFKAKRAMVRERGTYQQLKSIVIKTQQRWRAVKLSKQQKKHYDEMKTGALFVQRKWRANKVARQEKTKFNELKRAAVNIQRRWRAKKQGQEMKIKYDRLKKAASIIQIRWRARNLGFREKHSYKSLKTATVYIQRKWRANKLMKIEKESYRRMKRAAIIMQRRRIAKKLYQEANSNYKALKKATISVQCKWKAKKLGERVKMDYDKLRRATIIIQQRWRANKLGNQHRNRYVTLKKSAVIVQRSWRAKRLGKETRNQFINFKKATQTLQNRWRAKKMSEQQKQSYHSLRTAALNIQRRWRANKVAQKERENYETLRKAVITVQRKWVANKLSRCDRNRYVKLRWAAVVLQQKWRAKVVGSNARMHYQALKSSTIIIQRYWRAILVARRQRSYYHSLKTATIVMQRRWVAKRLGSEAKMSYLQLRNAVVNVQRRRRARKLGMEQRQNFEQMKKTTVYIQRRWRLLKMGKQVRNSFITKRSAAIVIQQRWRAKQLMKVQLKEYNLLKCATLVIQRQFRGYILMKTEQSQYIKLKNSVLVIQRYYRGYLMMKREVAKFQHTRQVVLGLQKYIMGYLIRQKYAYYFTAEAKEQRKIDKEKRAAAIKIQVNWRGYRCRSNEHPECAQIRQRLKKANANVAPEKTLDWKCKLALETFTNENSTLFRIVKALEDFDYATRRCKKICTEMAKVLPDQLYIMLSATSRSLPEMDACISSVNILITFCKFPPTKSCSFNAKYIDNLFTVMLHWCDKESPLFPTTCTLLWLFAHNQRWKNQILRIPNIDQKLKKIQSLVARKESMVKRAVNKGTSVFASYKHLPKPSLTPDWGLNYKSKPNVFSNSVHAFDSLLSILDM